MNSSIISCVTTLESVLFTASLLLLPSMESTVIMTAAAITAAAAIIAIRIFLVFLFIKAIRPFIVVAAHHAPEYPHKGRGYTQPEPEKRLDPIAYKPEAKRRDELPGAAGNEPFESKAHTGEIGRQAESPRVHEKAEVLVVRVVHIY